MSIKIGTETPSVQNLFITYSSKLDRDIVPREETFLLRKCECDTFVRAPQVPPKHPPSTPQAKKVLEFCISPRMREDIQNHLGLKDRKHLRQSILKPLVEEGLLSLTIPDKPNSPKQQYVITEKGKNLLKDSGV